MVNRLNFDIFDNWKYLSEMFDNFNVSKEMLGNYSLFRVENFIP